MNDNVDRSEEPVSDEEMEHYIRRFETLAKDLKEISEKLDYQTHKWVVETAGPRLEGFLKSRDETFQALGDPDARIRAVAIHLAVHHWQAGRTVANRCEHMAVKDPDLQVCDCAISILGLTYNGSQDPRIAHLLAAIVLNEEEKAIRRTAYGALVMVHGRSRDANARRLPPRRFPEDVDWSLVAKYYRPA